MENLESSTSLEVVDYSDINPEVDIIMVINEEDVVVLIPHSERAKSLFYWWGMQEDDTGVVPPENPMDFFGSVPSGWEVASVSMRPGKYILFKAPLPQPVPVVH